MTPEHWQRLQQVLDPVLDLPATERDAALERACAGDAALLAEARELLGCEPLPDATTAPLQVPREAFLEWDAVQNQHWIGHPIGPFTLESLLGSGGSSLVFAARRSDGFAQRVAIKLLRPDVAGGVQRRRFERERDILAQFSHPNIAGFHDAGFTESGVPWLALELVEGEHWDLHLRTLPQIEQRLALFLRVCDAVAYAHERLRVHRDLKPGNLMVDAQGHPKLLDFGIAALLESDAGDALTRENGSPLTPAWAAPEQVRGEAATTATDVHALGLLLFHLLTGRNPFQQGSDAQTLRAVQEMQPPRPSREAGEVRIPADMRRDLDNIVGMALEKEPARRYSTVRQLAADVQAAMQRRPVSARTQNVRYVAGRLWARHRLAISFSTLALAALLAALGAALWQGREAVRERERAAQGYEQVRSFAQRLIFDYQESIQKLPGSLPLQKRLVEDAFTYLQTLERDAGSDAAIVRELAHAWMKLGDVQGDPYQPNTGDTAGALVSYARSEAAIARLDDGQDTAILRARLAARRAGVLFEQLDMPRARAEFEAAIAAFEQAGADRGELAAELADALDIYGDLLGGQRGSGGLDEAGLANAAWQRAKALREAALADAPDSRTLRSATYKSHLRDGDRHMSEGDLAAAEADFGKSLDVLRALQASDPNDASVQREIALVQSRLGPVQDALGKHEEAIASVLESLTSLRAMLATDPANESLRQGATAVCGWASKLLIRAGRLDEAKSIVALQMSMGEERLAAAPGDLVAADNLSIAYRRQGELFAARGDYAAAIAANRKSLDLLGPLIGRSSDYDYSAAIARLHIGRNALAARDVALAREQLQKCVDELQALIAQSPEAEGWYGNDLAQARALLDETVATARK